MNIATEGGIVDLHDANLDSKSDSEQLDSNLEETVSEQLDTNEESKKLSPEEIERRALQSSRDKEREQRIRAEERTRILEEQLNTNIKKEEKIEKEPVKPISPQQFMPEDEKFDAYDSYSNPASDSFKARFRFEEENEKFITYSVRKAVREELATNDRQKGMRNEFEKLVSDPDSGITNENIASFQAFLKDPNAISIKDVALLFNAKTGVIKEEDVITRINRGTPYSPTAKRNTKDSGEKGITIEDDMRELYGIGRKSLFS